MKQSDTLHQNAANCAEIANRATERPAKMRYQRMVNSWLMLALEQDWLDGEVPTDAKKPPKADGVSVEELI